MFHRPGPDLHTLLEREGRGRSGTLLIRSQGFDCLTQQVPPACLLDRLQGRLRCVPAIAPPTHRFIIDLQMLGDAGVTGPGEASKMIWARLTSRLRTRRAAGHFLPKFPLQGTGMKRFGLRRGHERNLLRCVLLRILSYPPLLCYFRVAVLVLSSLNTITKESAIVAMVLRWAAPDPGLGAPVELCGGDTGGLFDLLGVGKTLSSQRIPPEKAPPALLQIEPARSCWNEDVMDAWMPFQPGSASPGSNDC